MHISYIVKDPCGEAGAGSRFLRHNHKYYYITSQNELQEVFGTLLFFYYMNKNILVTSCILNIAIWEKVCYTIVTTEEVQSNGKVKLPTLMGRQAEHKGI